jgi:hypothetical protein
LLDQAEEATMPQPLNWRLSVSLRDGKYAQIATMDFVRRETIDVQLVQLLFKQNDIDGRKLFEFKNELGELLAFRAATYGSHIVTALERHLQGA